MNEQKRSEYLEFAKSLAKEAGDIMLHYFRTEKLTTTWKEKNSPVTTADSEINRMVIERIQLKYPNHGIIGEEESFNSTNNPVWVVDPIDGTNLFHLGMPNSTFCLALVEDGVVQVSVVYDPYLKRLFFANKGGGVYLNGNKLKVHQMNELNRGYIFAQADKTDNSDTTSKIYKRLKEMGVKLVVIPSYTYMALAILEGRMLAAFMPYGSPWDAAAISLLIQEAGGKSTDLYGNDRKYNEWGEGILVSNGAVHQKLVELIAACES